MHLFRSQTLKQITLLILSRGQQKSKKIPFKITVGIYKREGRKRDFGNHLPLTKET